MIELRDYRDILVSIIQTGEFRGVRTPLVVDRKLGCLGRGQVRLKRPLFAPASLVFLKI